MKLWIKVICITSFVFQMTACSSSTQTNDSRPAQTAQKTVQQGTEERVALIFRKRIRTS
ncbi:hypothetical protein ABH963_003657 [Bacillus sp. RC55]